MTEANGSVYVVGSTGGEFTGNKNAGFNDAFLTTFDSNGNQSAVKQFGTSSLDFAVSVTVANSSVYVVGSTFGELPGNKSAGLCDAFLYREDVTSAQG